MTETNFKQIAGACPITINGTECLSVPCSLKQSDVWGSWKARWGFGRMEFMVKPGLYATGNPTENSPVLASANYKMSFDALRKELTSRNLWILVLDTKGINVWCAAGKGVFGTDELVRQIQQCRLDKIVNHNRIIVPQLGAPGISAHKVRSKCGFKVVYGPIYAADLPDFFDSGLRTTSRMRQVRFDLHDRIVLIPMELMMLWRKAALIALLFILLSGFCKSGFEFDRLFLVGFPSAGLFLAAYITGGALGSITLPWLPGRAFSFKGAVLGIVLTAVMSGYLLRSGNWAWTISWALMIPVVTSYMMMNSTGTSTYTSLSGVLRETKIALPIQICAAVLGIFLWAVSLFMWV
ncbi:MAG: hypothetical protein KAS23_12800 [Anaerohalosphaera sp.]|nr:hypothetical protein [Anaerohalosphaera sp.]